MSGQSRSRSSRFRTLAPAVYALGAGAVVMTGAPAPILIIFGVPLVLVAPGLAIADALRVCSQQEDPGRVFVISIALSMSGIILGGLLLDALFPLTRTTWTIWLVILTCAGSTVATVRRSAPEAPPDVAVLTAPKRARAQWAVAVIAAVGSVAGCIAITKVNARHAYDRPETQMTLTQTPTQPRVLRLTVSNLTNHAEPLVLRTAYNGRTARTRQITLKPGAQWAAYVPLPRLRLTASVTRFSSAQPLSTVVWDSATQAVGHA